jgi:hypothetical protein
VSQRFPARAAVQRAVCGDDGTAPPEAPVALRTARRNSIRSPHRAAVEPRQEHEGADGVAPSGIGVAVIPRESGGCAPLADLRVRGDAPPASGKAVSVDEADRNLVALRTGFRMNREWLASVAPAGGRAVTRPY